MPRPVGGANPIVGRGLTVGVKGAARPFGTEPLARLDPTPPALRTLPDPARIPRRRGIVRSLTVNVVGGG